DGAHRDRRRYAVPGLPASLQTLQIIDERLHFCWLDRHRGHVRPRLNGLRISNPAGKISFSIGKRAGGYRLAASEVCQIRANLRPCVRSANGMAQNARTLQEYIPPSVRVRIRRFSGGLKLTVHPCVEL